MRFPFYDSWLLPLGLVLVVLASFGIASLALTGVAMIALGAAAILLRRETTQSVSPYSLLLLQSSSYAAIYLIMLCAMMDAPDLNRPLLLFDIATSFGLVALLAPRMAISTPSQ